MASFVIRYLAAARLMSQGNHRLLFIEQSHDGNQISIGYASIRVRDAAHAARSSLFMLTQSM